jgi:ADP-ribose pyrophosphatase YjhB (NUDIX family)
LKTTNNEAIKLVADVALFFQNKVLLVKYSETNKYDHQSGWFLPDDLLKFNEHPDDGIQRIIREQIGVDIDSPKLDHIESFTGGDKSWHMIFHYAAELNSMPEIKTDSNISASSWFETGNLPDDKEIAHHGWARFTLETIFNN